MKILVTGAAGYIGSVLVGILLDANHTVLAFDDLSCGSDSLARYATRARFEFIRGDVCSQRDMEGAVTRADAIIPLAAVVGMKACAAAPMRAYAVNVQAVHLLMRLRSSLQQVVFPNTNSGYGNAEVFDADMPLGGVVNVCTEETPMEPISLYGRLKCDAERIVLDHENTTVLRLATVFGMSPRMRRDLLVNDFVWQALRPPHLLRIFEGHAMRNYVHVADVAHAFRVILEPLRMGEQIQGVYNFGNDSINMSKLDLAQTVAHWAGPQVQVAEGQGQDPDRRNYVVSSAKMKRAGIWATTGLEEGIRELIQGYRTMPELYR